MDILFGGRSGQIIFLGTATLRYYPYSKMIAAEMVFVRLGEEWGAKHKFGGS